MNAEVKIKDADTSSKAERKEMADWLRELATEVETEADDFAPNFKSLWRP